MKQLILLLFAFLTIDTFAQVYKNKDLFTENFSDNENPNSWNIVNSGYYANISNNQYQCYLPYNNRMEWSWTWVNFPQKLRSVFNQSSQINMEFDFAFDDNKDYNNFGLMFDLHHVTDDCKGGSFYELYFVKIGSKIETSFRKNDNCNLVETPFNKYGSSASLKNTNHANIKKVGLVWTVYVNEQIVLEINFTGNISLNKLKYGNGKYTFDNFKAYSTYVDLPEESNITNNPNLTPKIWALCVGIENYSQYPGYGKSINNLNYCIDDAQAYYKFLASPQGGKIPKEQLMFLSDATATNLNILQTANELFSKASENDLIIVFLSGHGGSGYYCASNGELRYEELNKILEKSHAKRKLLMADACHSGTWANQKEVFSSRGERLSEVDALRLFYNELSKSGQNVTYLLAARPEELSWEEGGNGVFTRFLINGLSCEAKVGTSPLITIDNIYRYLYDRVYEATKNKTYNGYLSPQHPVLEGKYDKNMPIAICLN